MSYELCDICNDPSTYWKWIDGKMLCQDCNDKKKETMLTRDFVDKMVGELFRRGYTGLSHPDKKFQGYPIHDNFIGYISPRIRDHVEQLQGFISRGNYPDPHYPELPKNEIGQLGNLRIIIDDRMDPKKLRIEAIHSNDFDIE